MSKTADTVFNALFMLFLASMFSEHSLASVLSFGLFLWLVLLITAMLPMDGRLFDRARHITMSKDFSLIHNLVLNGVLAAVMMRWNNTYLTMLFIEFGTVCVFQRFCMLVFPEFVMPATHLKRW